MEYCNIISAIQEELKERITQDYTPFSQINLRCDNTVNKQKPFYPLQVQKDTVFFSSLINICAKPDSDIIKCYRLKCLTYADGAQLYILFYQETENSAVQILIACRNKAPAKY